jgi:hypothetical protein
MKRFFTFLFMTALVCSLFAQPKTKVLYFANADPVAAGDTLMPGILEDLGFDVKIETATDKPTTADYEVAFGSEVMGSSSTFWAAYSTAPIPLVCTKVHAMKSSALKWLPDGVAGTTKIHYDNSSDTVFTVIDATSDIVKGFGSTIQASGLIPAATVMVEAQIGWINIPPVTGMKIICQTGPDSANHAGLVTFDAGTVLNSSVTLVSKAVSIGYHQQYWRFLNDDGKLLLKRSLLWAAGKKVVDVADNFSVKTSVYPNPAMGLVNLKFSENVGNATVKVLAIDGREVFSTQLTNTQFQTLDLSELHSGIYLIHVEGTNLSFTDRLILN